MNNYYYDTQKLGKLEWRSWWHFGKYTLGWSWNLNTNFCHIQVGSGIYQEENQYDFSIAFPPIAFWLHWEVPYNNKRILKNKEYSLKIHHGQLWWQLGDNPDHWSNKRKANFFEGNWDFTRWFLGKEEYSEEDIIPKQSIILQFPEQEYQATIRVLKSIWTRTGRIWSKLIPAKTIIRCEIDIPEGIRLYKPAKWGNNEDRLYNTIFPLIIKGKQINLTKIIREFKNRIFLERNKYDTRTY